MSRLCRTCNVMVAENSEHDCITDYDAVNDGRTLECVYALERVKELEDNLKRIADSLEYGHTHDEIRKLIKGGKI